MTPRQRFIGWIVVAVLVLGGLGYLFNGVTDRLAAAERDADRNDALASANSKALQEANGRVDALGEQVRGLGEDPVVSTSPVQRGTVVIPGPQGQVGERGLRGLVGLPGAPGAAGRNGQDGAPGEAGATGPQGAAGPQGPQGERGPAGADGSDGANGADGRGISDVECTDGRWIVTYTDDTTSDAGDCQPSLIEVPAP